MATAKPSKTATAKSVSVGTKPNLSTAKTTQEGRKPEGAKPKAREDAKGTKGASAQGVKVTKVKNEKDALKDKQIPRKGAQVVPKVTTADPTRPKQAQVKKPKPVKEETFATKAKTQKVDMKKVTLKKNNADAVAPVPAPKPCRKVSLTEKQKQEELKLVEEAEEEEPTTFPKVANDERNQETKVCRSFPQAVPQPHIVNVVEDEQSDSEPEEQPGFIRDDCPTSRYVSLGVFSSFDHAVFQVNSTTAVHSLGLDISVRLTSRSSLIPCTCQCWVTR